MHTEHEYARIAKHVDGCDIIAAIKSERSSQPSAENGEPATWRAQRTLSLLLTAKKNPGRTPPAPKSTKESGLPPKSKSFFLGPRPTPPKISAKSAYNALSYLAIKRMDPTT